MSFEIRTDEYELKAQCSIPSFSKRSELVTTLMSSAIETTIKYCEALSEDDLGASHIDWKQSDEIVSAFLDEGLFQKWADMVARDLGEYAVQIPD